MCLLLSSCFYCLTFPKITCWHNLSLEHHFPLSFLTLHCGQFPPPLPDGQAERDHHHPTHTQRPAETKQMGSGWGREGRSRAFEFGTKDKRGQGHTSFFAAGWLFIGMAELDRVLLVPQSLFEGQLTHLLGPADLELSLNLHPFASQGMKLEPEPPLQDDEQRKVHQCVFPSPLSTWLSDLFM